MKKYIDIHAHKKNSAGNAIAVLNLFPDKTPESGSFYSAGLHPWHIQEENIDNDMKIIRNLLKRDNVIAVGECGLDRAQGAAFDLQEKVFAEHIKIADEFKLPLIIHCVRAYSDILHFKKTKKNKSPWIIHGFNGNRQISEELIKHHVYLSFGMKNLELKADIFKELPAKMIFLETDENRFNIEEVYEEAAKTKNIRTEELTKQINDNFKVFLGKNIDE
jgi:TatD DNase family protein